MSDPVEPVERGRYAIFEQDDGGLVIPRSAPLCERCAECGCGEQQEPIRVPGAVRKLAEAARNGDMSIAGKMKAMMRL